jgi:hypothetical protein
MGIRNVKRLLESAPAVIPFVRHLRLLGKQRQWDETLPLLAGFESIRSLSVSHLSVRRLNAQALSALFHNFSAAVDVRLDAVRFATAGKLIRFICAFPCLQRLAVHCSGPRSDEFGVDLPTPTTFSLSPHLRVLELNYTCMDAVLDWFLSLPGRPALHTVGLHPIRSNKSESIAKLLLTLENSLESFLISTAMVHGTFVIFLSLIHAACQAREPLANRPTPQHTPTLPSN